MLSACAQPHPGHATHKRLMFRCWLPLQVQIIMTVSSCNSIVSDSNAYTLFVKSFSGQVAAPASALSKLGITADKVNVTGFTCGAADGRRALLLELPESTASAIGDHAGLRKLAASSDLLSMAASIGPFAPGVTEKAASAAVKEVLAMLDNIMSASFKTEYGIQAAARSNIISTIITKVGPTSTQQSLQPPPPGSVLNSPALKSSTPTFVFIAAGVIGGLAAVVAAVALYVVRHRTTRRVNPGNEKQADQPTGSAASEQEPAAEAGAEPTRIAVVMDGTAGADLAAAGPGIVVPHASGSRRPMTSAGRLISNGGSADHLLLPLCLTVSGPAAAAVTAASSSHSCGTASGGRQPVYAAARLAVAPFAAEGSVSDVSTTKLASRDDKHPSSNDHQHVPDPHHSSSRGSLPMLVAAPRPRISSAGAADAATLPVPPDDAATPRVTMAARPWSGVVLVPEHEMLPGAIPERHELMACASTYAVRPAGTTAGLHLSCLGMMPDVLVNEAAPRRRHTISGGAVSTAPMTGPAAANTAAAAALD